MINLKKQKTGIILRKWSDLFYFEFSIMLNIELYLYSLLSVILQYKLTIKFLLPVSDLFPRVWSTFSAITTIPFPPRGSYLMVFIFSWTPLIWNKIIGFVRVDAACILLLHPPFGVLTWNTVTCSILNTCVFVNMNFNEFALVLLSRKCILLFCNNIIYNSSLAVLGVLCILQSQGWRNIPYYPKLGFIKVWPLFLSTNYKKSVSV